MKTIALLLTAAALLAAPVTASAAAGPSPFAPRATITTEAAERIAKACIAFADQRNLKLSIVILDAVGDVIYTYKMDGSTHIALDTAGRKAKTAWTFRTPTSVLAQRNNGPGPNIPEWIGLFPILGGLPIMSDGQVAGAIGVGGGAPPNDEQCGQAGLDAVGIRAPAPAPAPAAAPAR